ncbi:hypothetical protein, conserved [Babesia bigemina]|uniref:Uncharacterized protein n=1 Tax=Babesia bigemina TaxID=5866 RepID=A0A061BKU2_BABBI|nr:hypothetical protein, conserved [Babesia bigemina]CDR71545.1 hypothetical protein, conserved [Babesia bigemina]|eukprot:XP_012770491.1 hypothetical protein, conserved [Babesia bigemina]
MASHSISSIKNNFIYVKEICDNFAQNLAKEINDSDIYAFSNDIVEKIENDRQLLKQGIGEIHNPFYLKPALHAVLSQLIGQVRGAANKIDKIIQQCNIAYVDSAYNKAKELVEKLEKALKLGTHAVDSAIDGVTKTLDAEIGNDEVSKQTITSLPTQKFTNYRSFVGQDNLSSITHENLDQLAGSLPAAIGDIERQVTTKLTAGNLKFEISDGQTFQSPFSTIEQQLNKIAGLVDSSKNTGSSSEGIQQYLGALDEMLTGKGAVNISAKDVNPNAVQGLEKIKNDIGLLQTKNIENVKHNLNELCAAVRWAANEVNWFLREMKKGQIDEKLVGIRKQIDDLRVKEIQGTITLCTDFLQKATESGQVTIKALEKYVDEQVADAIKTITTQAKKHYVSTLKTELQHFTARVQGHLTGLTTLIDKDLVQGYKGLMKTVQGVKFIVKLKETSEFETSADTALFTKLQTAVPLPPGQEKPTKENFKALVDAFEHYFNNIHGYVKNEIKRLNEQHEQTLNYKPTHAESEYNKKVNASRLDGVHNELTKIIYQLKVGMRYDRYLPGLLDGLSEALDGLRPECYALPSTPLLDCIGSGLRGFVGELRMAYISVYDCAAYDFNWDADGRKCAKVCLTIIPVLFNELYPLFYHCCNGWKTYRIEGRDNKNELRDYLQNQGYAIDNLKKDHAGREVAVCCNVGFKERNEFDKDAHDFESLDKYITHYEGKGVVSKLFTHLNDYYKVCHLSTSSATRNPSSVYDMLQWLCGLSYNVVYHDLSFDGFSGLFEKPEEPEYEEGGVSFGDEDEDTLSAYPRNITASDMRDTLTEVCHYSHDVLVGLIGHGHADGIYAVDFNTNSQGFSYPSRYGQCIDMLVDILHRLYQQLYFVYCQCCNDEICSGWRGCLYGNAIGGSDWKCNSKQCADQKCNQKVNQTCELHPKCGVKSPLQSYLEDGLPGFLPHSFKKPGCKLECTVSNHRGIPCKTPMGFTDISTMASHTQTR